LHQLADLQEDPMSFHIRWPTQFNLITQEFAARPEFYAKFGLPGHEGIDFEAPEGTELYAVADGVVFDVRPDGDSDPVGKPYGNQVRIQHDEVYSSIYAHLVQIIAQKGQPVSAGQLIGLAGNTGNSFGAHLHLTIKKAGATQNRETSFPYDIIDPTPYLGTFGEGTQPAPPPQPTLQVQVNSPEVGYLNIRNTPSTSGALVVRVSDGAQLGALEPENIARSKVGQQNQWMWVRAPEGQTGYAAAWYLRLRDTPVEPAAPLSVVVTSPDVPLKVRGGPGTDQPILAEAPHGTVLQALESEAVVRSKVGQQGQWLKVQTPAGVVGYSAAWYLGLQQGAPATAAVSFALPMSLDLAQAEEAPMEEERKLVHADDLTRIRGIGPKTAAALAAKGLVIYEQLVSFKPGQLKAWLAAKGIRGRYAATWPKQARLIVEGRWKALATLQKKLTKK
jgi:predicted flap endonuclease-1-like 5' DNA nuclease